MNTPPAAILASDERATRGDPTCDRLGDERAPLGEPTGDRLPPTPIVFECSLGSLTGFHHAARPSLVRATNVVLCPPVGYDAMLTHRTYRHLAERLGALGFHVLRFDYHGTGDSAGRQDEPGRVAAWLAGIDAAIDELSARTGIGQVTLFGVRTGALLAAASAAWRRDVATLVLWAPGSNGRAYVREFRAFNTVKRAAFSARGAPAEKDEVVAGYFFSAETLHELSQIDLMKTELGAVKQALVLGRDDLLGAEQRLVAHWTAKGVHVEQPNVAGYAGMMRDAEFSTLPDAALGYIVDWLAAAHGPSARAGGFERRASPSNVLLTKSRGARTIAERVLAYDDAGRLFGVLAQPTEPIGRRARTAMLLLNVGSNHHIGPHRMYVTLSRELAALGFSAFRLDVAGLGESAAPSGGKENSLYAHQSILDVQQAMTFLTRIIDAERFVLAGICSGAYLAFHATAADTRVSGQVLVNPQTFEWREGDSLELKTKRSYKASRYYRQALFDKDTWLRLYRREINLRGIAGELFVRSRQQIVGRVARAARVFSRSADAADRVARSFAAISDRGTHSLLVYSGNDGGIDVVESHLGPLGGRMRRRTNFRFEIIEGADHTITPLPSQERLERLLLAYMCSVFGDEGGWPKAGC